MMDAAVKYIHDGGFFMYPIIIGTLWALMLLIERTIFLFQTGGNLSRQVSHFYSLLNNRNEKEAFEYIKNQKGVLRNVLIVALENRTLSIERVSEKMEMVLSEYLPIYSKYLNLLSALAALMPVFGLLGTVSGMIVTFNVIALHGTGDAQAMAGGIAEALITTQAGLVAASPIILGHVLIMTRIKKVSDKTKEACVKMVDYLKEHHV